MLEPSFFDLFEYYEDDDYCLFYEEGSLMDDVIYEQCALAYYSYLDRVANTDYFSSLLEIGGCLDAPLAG